MNFWQIFVRVFPWRPLPALAALWWQITRRRLRARNLLCAAGASLPFAYEYWMRTVECSAAQKQNAKIALESWRRNPKFVVVLDARNSNNEDLSRSIRSIQLQGFPHWAIVMVGPPPESAIEEWTNLHIVSSWHAALNESSGDFIIPLKSGDELSKWALFHFAKTLESAPSAVIVYGDEDEIDATGRRKKPWFKPRWNEELFLARDYLSRACAVSAAAARDIGPTLDFRSDLDAFELLLAVVKECEGPIVHVPKIVAHVARRPEHWCQNSRVDLVAKCVTHRGATATAGPFDSVKISWPLPAEHPMVSIIVPTRDKIDLLGPCIESVLAKTNYQPFEILIIDNASREPATFRYFEDIRGRPEIRVLPYPGPYNYAAINNHATLEAKGSFLCLLNNDTEVVSEDWLTEMMRYAVRAETGAVGAKLLYADGTIQHAGVIVGIGNAAGHAHRNLRSDDPGYFCHAHVTQYMSAVTGACLVVDKQKFLHVGGLDEECLPIAYNDVDLCLKLERAGWRNIYVPHAVLIHHESRSRGNDHAPSQIDRYKNELKAFQDRWGAATYDDPQFNPNFDRSNETFVIRL